MTVCAGRSCTCIVSGLTLFGMVRYVVHSLPGPLCRGKLVPVHWGKCIGLNFAGVLLEIPANAVCAYLLVGKCDYYALLCLFVCLLGR